MKTSSGRFFAFVAVLSLACNVLLYMRYSSTRPLVTVGKEVITRKQYQDQLERQAGPQVLSKMVFDKMVTQAAVRDGVMPTPQYVDERIQDIQRRSPQILVPYAQDPAKMAEFRHDLQSGLALENLQIKDVALSPTQVAQYYAAHRNKFALPQQVQTTVVLTRSSLDTTTAVQLLKQNTPNDVLARQPRLGVVGLNNVTMPKDLPGDLNKQISSFVHTAPVNGIRTFPVMRPDKTVDYYLTFQVTKSSSAMIPPLAQVQDMVQREARLANAPSPQAEIARLYQAAKPTFSSDKYAAYFGNLQSGAGQDTGNKTASDR